MQIKRILNPEEKSRIAEHILAALPDWFGLPDSTKEYIRQCRQLPFWAAFPTEKNIAVGFIALKETSPATAEIYVMGVLPEYHRKGIGRQLFNALQMYARTKKYSFLQVKTVQEGHYTEYDCTNRFYKKLGFQELECFPTLWDEWNPCQILIMSIPKLSIRPYHSDDWERINEIHDSARLQELKLAGIEGAFLPLSTAAEREGLVEYAVCVACLNDKVVGFTAYDDQELAWLYVDPLYSRQGIGRSLIQHVIDHTNCRPLKIEVLAGNTPAINLYHSMDFYQTRKAIGVMPGNEDWTVTVYCLERK